MFFHPFTLTPSVFSLKVSPLPQRGCSPHADRLLFTVVGPFVCVRFITTWLGSSAFLTFVLFTSSLFPILPCFFWIISVIRVFCFSVYLYFFCPFFKFIFLPKGPLSIITACSRENVE